MCESVIKIMQIISVALLVYLTFKQHFIMVTLAQIQELLSRQTAAIEKLKQAHSDNGLNAVDENTLFEQLTASTTQLEEYANSMGQTPFPTEPPVETPPVIPSPEEPVNPDQL